MILGDTSSEFPSFFHSNSKGLSPDLTVQKALPFSPSFKAGGKTKGDTRGESNKIRFKKNS